MEYPELAQRLTPEAEALLNEAVEAHLAAAGGSREIVVIRTGSGKTLMALPGRQAVQADGPALNDLVVEYDLIRVCRHDRRGEPIYQVRGEGIAFHAWLRAHRGQPIDTVEHVVRQLVDGEAFTAQHRSSGDHPREAFALLCSDRTDVQTVRVLGVHLSKRAHRRRAGRDRRGLRPATRRRSNRSWSRG